MRRVIKPIPLLFLAFFLLFAPSCSREDVVFRDGGYYHLESGVNYRACHVALEPNLVGEAYAGCGDFTFFRIKGADPLLWLCDDENLVYRADVLPEPTLGDFSPDCLYVGLNSDDFFALTEITDAGLINDLVSCFSTPDQAVLPASCDGVWQLKFTSSAFPWLRYSVIYAEKDGVSYLKDRGSGLCADAKNLLSEVLHGPAAEKEA